MILPMHVGLVSTCMLKKKKNTNNCWVDKLLVICKFFNPTTLCQKTHVQECATVKDATTWQVTGNYHLLD